MGGEFVGSALCIFVNANWCTVQIECRDPNLRLDEFKSVTLKCEVINNLWQQWASAVGERGAKARVEFFGDAGTTDDTALFEHKWFQSSFREIVGRHETIVASADY